MQTVSGSLMLFLSCEDKNLYWISLKSNILKWIINPWNQNACTWTSLQVLCWFHLSHDTFNDCILATESQVKIKVKYTDPNQEAFRHVLNLKYKLQWQETVFELNLCLNSSLNYSRDICIYGDKRLGKWGYLIRMHKYYIISSHFCSTLFLQAPHSTDKIILMQRKRHQWHCVRQTLHCDPPGMLHKSLYFHLMLS